MENIVFIFYRESDNSLALQCSDDLGISILLEMNYSLIGTFIDDSIIKILTSKEELCLERV